MSGMEVGHSCMQGFRCHMEDKHIVSQFKDLPDHTLLAVLDGHAGKGVSTYVSLHLQGVLEKTAQWGAYCRLSPTQRAEKNSDNKGKGIELLQEALVQAYCDMDNILRQAMTIGKLEPSGSTLVCTIITPSHIVCASVGDSRCVVGLNNGQAIALTEDHKPDLPEEKHRIEEAGGKVEMNRVQGELAMSRALGDFQYKSLELHQAYQMVTCYPDVSVFPRTEADSFLILACDGVWDVMSNQDAITFLHSIVPSVLDEESAPLTSEELAEELIDLALNLGSMDNISALVVKLNVEEKAGKDMIRALHDNGNKNKPSIAKGKENEMKKNKENKNNNQTPAFSMESASNKRHVDESMQGNAANASVKKKKM